MKSIIILLVCACALAAAASADEPREYDLNKAPELFEVYIKKFTKHYKDEADKKVHYEAFVQNLKRINQLNKEHPNTTYGINQFTDYTEEELKNTGGFGVPHNN